MAVGLSALARRAPPDRPGRARGAGRRREHVPRCASGDGAWPGSTRRQSLDELEGFPDVTLDTSHLAVSGIDPVEAAARLGDRLAHVHLSNNAGKGWDSHLPLDEGVLDLGPFLEALAARGFRGAISLEIDLRDHLDDDQALRGILSRNRDLCEAGLTLPA